MMWIPPRGTTTLDCIVQFDKTAGIASGVNEFKVLLENGVNENDTAEVSIVADFIVKLLTFSDRARGVLGEGDQELVLPSLTVSMTSRDADTSGAACNAWFSVKNTYNQPVLTHIRAAPVDALLGVIRLQPAARESNTFIKQFTLNPNETMHVRVSCAADTSARLLHSVMDLLEAYDGPNKADHRTMTIGSLTLEATPVNASLLPQIAESGTLSDTFTIAGVLIPGETFGLSTTSLDFGVNELPNVDDDEPQMRTISISPTLLSALSSANAS
jgi:hypothetical protein